MTGRLGSRDRRRAVRRRLLVRGAGRVALDRTDVQLAGGDGLQPGGLLGLPAAQLATGEWLAGLLGRALGSASRLTPAAPLPDGTLRPLTHGCLLLSHVTTCGS